MATYKPIQSITVRDSSTTSITFSSVDQTYTDLVIVCNASPSVNNYGFYMYFNGSTASSYSGTVMHGSGSSASGTRFVSANTPGTSNWVGGQILGLSNSAGANSFTIDINNYRSETLYKGYICKSYSGNNGTEISTGLWSGSTAPITSITIGAQSAATILPGSTFSLYGIKAGTPKAIGGDVTTTDGTYWYHAFKTSGTFTVQQGSALTVDYLVVAGGGGGGASSTYFGGGGAGGYRSATSQSLNPTVHTVIVGAGGAANTKGSNSSVNSFSATGGGFGGNGTYVGSSTSLYSGGPGGSGGGAGNRSDSTYPPNSNAATSGVGNQGGYSPVEGYSGGTGYTGAGNASGSGGGGAGGAGAQASQNSSGGAGGVGSNAHSSWATATGTGASGYYAGGGGGGVENGSYAGGAGGSGGGGKGYGNNGAATSGSSNTGGGGGGGSASAGSGGSGIVILRYTV